HRLCRAAGATGNRHDLPLGAGAGWAARSGSRGDPISRRRRRGSSERNRGDVLMDPTLIGEILAGLMFFGIIGFLLLGFPVAFTLAGVSLMFGAVGMWFGAFDPSNFGALPNRYIGF